MIGALPRPHHRQLGAAIRGLRDVGRIPYFQMRPDRLPERFVTVQDVDVIADTFLQGTRYAIYRHIEQIRHQRRFFPHSHFYFHSPAALRLSENRNTNSPRAKLNCDATVKLPAGERSETGAILTYPTSAAMIPPRTWPRRGRAKMAAPGLKIQRGRA